MPEASPEYCIVKIKCKYFVVFYKKALLYVYIKM